MSEHMSPIPSRIYNAAVGGHVCGPEDVDFGQKVVHLIKYDRSGNEVSFESQVTQANKIYVIHDDFTLSSNVNIQANCTLQFDGGSISGAYTITGNNTGINAGLIKIFGTDVILDGSWNVKELPVEWFGAKGDGVTDDTAAIQRALDMAEPRKSGIMDVKLLISHTYKLTDTLKIGCFINFGSSSNLTDHRPNGDDSIAILKQTANKDALMICEDGYYTAPSRIKIYGIHFVGYDKYANSAISTESGVGYLNLITFEKVTFRNFKFGINLQNDETKIRSLTHITFRNVRCQDNSIGMAVYIKAAYYCYSIKFYNCNFSFTYIKAVHIEVRYGITDPITFEGCLIEACGKNYRIADIQEYGGGAITVDCYTYKTEQDRTNGFSPVNIIDCYFENNSPTRDVDGNMLSGEKLYSYTYSGNTVQFYGIDDTDASKSAELCFGCCSPNIQNSFFSYTYAPPVVLKYAGAVVCNYNKLVHQRSVPKYKSLVHLISPYKGLHNIRVNIDESNITKQEVVNGDLTDSLKQSVSIPAGTSSNGYCAKVNFPIVQETHTYNYCILGMYYDETVTLYVDSDSNGYSGVGYPVQYCETLADAFNLVKGDTFINAKDVTIILKSDTKLLRYADNIFKRLAKIQFGSLTIKSIGSQKHTVRFNTEYNTVTRFENLKVTFENVIIENNAKNTNQFIGLFDSDITFVNCDFVFKVNTPLIRSYGRNSVTLVRCNITSDEGIVPWLTLNSDYGELTTKFLNVGPTASSTYTIPDNLKYQTCIDVVAMASHPNTDHLSIGSNYFNTTYNKQVYWTGKTALGDNGWVDALGNHPSNTVYPKVIGTPTTGNIAKFNGTNIEDYGNAGTGTSGNFAGFDANGKLTDSGKKPSDFEPAQS